MRPIRPKPSRPRCSCAFFSLLIRHAPIGILARTTQLLTLPALLFLFLTLVVRDRDLDLGFELGFDLDDEELEVDIDEE